MGAEASRRPDPVRFVIRDAVPADVPALREVFRRASLSNEGDRRALLAHPDALEFPGLGGDDRRTRVAAADGSIAGFATSLPAGDVIELDDLFVDPGWMRQGAGRALVLDAVAIARGLGAGRIEVTANPHALLFYERAGFTADHEVRTRFGPGLRMHLGVTP
jgi:GNAT superfamily N-acetyltransferase